MSRASQFSVALATCNGATYLPALLDSLLAQTLLPMELVASDDVSTDETLAMLEAFSKRSPFPVRVLRNSSRLGVNGNFSRAMNACMAENIAFADQDDIWRPDKLLCLSWALSRPGAVAAFSDAEVVASDMRPLGYTMWRRVRFTSKERLKMAQGAGFEVLLKHRVVTGATLAFKAELKTKALPIPDCWPHDAWLAMVAASEGGLIAVDRVLIDYRQHDGNVTGGRKRSLLEEIKAAMTLDRAAWYRDEIACWKELAERLPHAPSSPFLQALNGKIRHLEVRAGLPEQRFRRFGGVMREIFSGRYARYARNWGSAAIDLFIK